MKKKMGLVALLLVLVMVLSLGLVACHKDSGGDSSSSDSSGGSTDNSGGGGDTSGGDTPDEGVAIEKYLESFVKASKSLAPEVGMTSDDAFVSTVHFDLFLDKEQSGAKKTTVKVGVDVEACVDKKNPANSSIQLKIKDQVVPHEIGVIVSLRTPQFIYVNYLDQKFRFEVNNGVIETDQITDKHHPIYIVKNLLNTRIDESINKMINNKNAQEGKPQDSNIQLPMYGGEYSGVTVPLTFTHVIDAFLNVPFGAGDKTVTSEWNVMTPINRLVQATELVPYAYLTFGKKETVNSFNRTGIISVINNALKGNAMAEMLGSLIENVVPIVEVANPGLGDAVVKKIFNEGYVESDEANIKNAIKNSTIRLDKLVDMLVNPKAVLGDDSALAGLVKTLRNQMFDAAKTSSVAKNNKVEYTTAIGSVVGQLAPMLSGLFAKKPELKGMVESALASLGDMSINYVTSGDGNTLENVSIVFSTTNTSTKTKTSTGFSISDMKTKKAVGQAYADTLVAELNSYSEYFDIDAKTQFVIEGLTIKGFSIDGTYNLIVRGGFDFSMTPESNLYVGLVEDKGEAMLEATLKGDVVMIKIGSNLKMQAIMAAIAPSLVEVLTSPNNPPAMVNLINTQLKPVMLIEEANGVFKYNTEFEGFKVTNVNVAKAIKDSMLSTGTPSVPSVGVIQPTLSILNLMNPVEIVKKFLQVGIQDDVNHENFIKIQLEDIDHWFEVKDGLKGKIFAQSYNQKAAYLLGSTPNYVRAFTPMFKDLDKGVNAIQAEIMYMFTSNQPKAYEAYDKLHEAVFKYNQAPNKASAIYTEYKAACENDQDLKKLMVRSQSAFVTVAKNVNFNAFLDRAAVDQILQNNPVTFTVGLLAGSKFFTNASNIMTNFMKASLYVDFKVNGTLSEGNLIVTVPNGAEATKVSINAKLKITAAKAVGVPTINEFTPGKFAEFKVNYQQA